MVLNWRRHPVRILACIGQSVSLLVVSLQEGGREVKTGKGLYSWRPTTGRAGRAEKLIGLAPWSSNSRPAIRFERGENRRPVPGDRDRGGAGGLEVGD